MRTLLIILVIFGAGVFVLPLWAIAATILMKRRLAKLPDQPRPAFKCPRCGSEQVEVLSSGFWDGTDESGRDTGGVFEYGVCKRCHERCARFVDDQPFVPTDQQWQSHFGPQERWQKERESWPFEPRDEKDAG